MNSVWGCLAGCCFEGSFKACFPPKGADSKPTGPQRLAHYLGMNRFLATVIMDATWDGELATKMVRTPKDHGMSFEDVRFPALDGCQIAAWYIPAKDASSKKLAIVGHQSWACANKSGCVYHVRHGAVPVQPIDYVKLQRVLYDAGFHVVAYDLRNHGDSERRLPAGFGETEFMDCAGVMDWVNAHTVLKQCKVALLPFCVSGVAFMKANSLYPDKFKNVAAWATTNIFHGPVMFADRPFFFGLGNVQLLNEALQENQAKHAKTIKFPDINMKVERMSAKMYAKDVKVPVLYCDALHDPQDYHERGAPEIFEEFGKGMDEASRNRNELHFLGPRQEPPFKTQGRNRSEGYNFYQSEEGSKVLLGFLSKYCP
ncbi:unnamed protein product [Symbiodinium pilosum]|uniref:Serine aminopeptidase S33 domain-containing protein n=1 Tax=Symbiodinium pilosum TaxID=2952 RepID=A0A812Y8Y9_SYMPI|nr:unnamed protein product [Symbiodinium pilosum]